jgi:hypothetical protein
MLQGGRSQVRFPMRSLNFSIDLILSTVLWPWGRLQPLREMSTRNFRGGEGRLMRKAHNITGICKPNV